MRSLVSWQDELAVSYVGLVSISVDAPMVAAAYQAGLGARWPFLSDESRTAMRALGILDATEGEYPDVSRPFTFVLRPDLTVHRVYDGWFFVGRPSIDELRHDVREVFEGLPMYPYEAYDTERVKRLRIPAATWQWHDGPPAPGPDRGGLDVRPPVGQRLDPPDRPGPYPRGGVLQLHGHPRPWLPHPRRGTPVTFELVQNPTGPSARNVQRTP